jgi:signal transduction histidine kinase
MLEQPSRWLARLAALSLTCWCALGAAAAWVQAVQAVQPVQLTNAQCLDSQAESPPDDTAAWRACTLPDRWSATKRAAVSSVWYRFTLPARAQAAGSPALLLPVLSMNAQLWIGGQRVADTRDGADGRTTRHWNHPWLVPLPGTPSSLHVRVQASVINEGLLAAPWWGSVEELLPRHEALTLTRVTLPGWGLIFGISLGLVFVLIRLYDAQQRTWGYFGAGALLWSLGTLNLTVLHVPVADAVWETAIHVLVFFGLLCLVLFGLSFARALTPLLRKVLLAYGAVAGVLVVVITQRGDPQVLMWVLLPMLLAAAYAMATIVRHSRAQRGSGTAVFAAVAGLTLAAGCNDWAMRAGWLPLDRPFLLPLAVPLVLTALAWLLARDHARIQMRLAQSMRELDDKVRQRERELNQLHAQEAQAQSELAVLRERARILRDMHDGAGAHLSTAIRMVESGAAAPETLQHSLRDALDQLKLSIDTLDRPPGDVQALLASIRYRLGPRLERAGIQVVWQVQDLPNWPRGELDWAMQHLQFIVFEAFSNVLQHAQATQLRVQARATSSAIELTFADNGRGLRDGESPKLKSMQARAQLVEAQLQVANAHPGLSVTLRLPLQPV